MIEVLYEDNHIIAVNKKVSDIVQGDKTGDITLADETKAYIKKKYNKPGDVYLGIPHRLDRPVSGVIIFARTSKALTRLNLMFQDHEDMIVKTYWAIVCKLPEKDHEVLIDFVVKDDKFNRSHIYDSAKKGAKMAKLEYTLIGSSQRYYLLNIRLFTGRHHQIRGQLAKIGCSIKGDIKYGAPSPNQDGGISLHARSISFVHPVSQKRLTIVAEPNTKDQLWKIFSEQNKGR